MKYNECDETMTKTEELQREADELCQREMGSSRKEAWELVKHGKYSKNQAVFASKLAGLMFLLAED